MIEMMIIVMMLMRVVSLSRRIMTILRLILSRILRTVIER